MSLVPCLAYIYKLDCTTCINPWKGRKAYWVIGFYGTCCESWVPSLRPIYVGICCPSFPLFGSENKKSVWNTTLVFNVLEFESSSMAVKIGKNRMPPHLLDPTNLIHKHILPLHPDLSTLLRGRIPIGAIPFYTLPLWQKKPLSFCPIA